MGVVPKWLPTRCRDCKRSAHEGHKISRRGLCEACAVKRETANARALALGTGPEWERWRKAQRRAYLRWLREQYDAA